MDSNVQIALVFFFALVIAFGGFLIGRHWDEVCDQWKK